MVALSEPGLRPSRMVAALEVVRTVAFHHPQGLVVVDGSLDVARQFGADVLEIAAGDNARDARGSLHQWALVGAAVSTADEVDAALSDPDISHLIVGPLAGSDGAPDLDLVGYTALAAPPGDVASKPWFAAGGIAPDNVDDVFAAGARRLFVSEAVVGHPDPRSACEQFKGRLRRLWNSDDSMQGYVFGVLSSGS